MIIVISAIYAGYTSSTPNVIGFVRIDSFMFSIYRALTNISNYGRIPTNIPVAIKTAEVLPTGWFNSWNLSRVTIFKIISESVISVAAAYAWSRIICSIRRCMLPCNRFTSDDFYIFRYIIFICAVGFNLVLKSETISILNNYN